MKNNPEITEEILVRRSIYYTLAFIFLLWLVKAVEVASGLDFATFGILPRTLRGIVGILTGPLIHGSMLHLMSNTVPLLMLGIGLWYFYYNIALEVFLWIYLVSGFWVWLLAREAYHIGASGLVYGIAAFLFFSGLARRDNRLMIVSAIIIFLYGGMLYGIFPNMVDADISWESHLLASLVGIILAFIFRKTPTYHTLDEDNEEDEDETDRGGPPGFSPPTATGAGQASYKYEYKPGDQPDKG